MHSLSHFAKLTLFLFLGLSANSVQAQIAIDWQKCLGGTGDDRAKSIAQTSDKGFIVAGYTFSGNGDVSGYHDHGDFWVVKLASNGNIQWQQCLGGSSTEKAYSVLETTDSCFIIAGVTTSNDGDITGNHGSNDFWLVKLDNSGNLIWQKCFGGTNIDDAYSVQQTADGGYVVVGNSNSNNGDVTGNHNSIDYWIVKLDGGGNIQWQKSLGGTNSDLAYHVQQTSDGGYIVAGFTGSNDGDVSGNHGSNDAWIVKLDIVGNIQWQKCFGGTNQDYAQSIEQTTDGGYVLAGSTHSIDGDVSGNHGVSDYWIIRLDNFGNIRWQQCLGGTSIDNAFSVEQTADGGFVVAGHTNSNDGNVTGNNGSPDFWIVKLDVMGSIMWQKSLGGSNVEAAYSIHQAIDGGYIVAGTTFSNDGDVSGNHGSYDFWVVKLTEHYNNISGMLYADINSNNVHDTGEPFLGNKKVTEQNTGRFGISNSTGKYHVLVLDSGNYSVAAEPVNHFTAMPSLQNAYFSNIQQTDSLNDFAFQPTGTINDLCITITPATPFRQGMNATYVIHYENVGTTTISNCSVIFFPDNLISFVGANATPFSITPDSITWNIGTLTPFQTGSIIVTVNVQVGTPIGSTINSGVRIEPVAGDANPNCNAHYWEIATSGAVDPNDILVNRNTLFTTEFPNPPFLDYIIRFQNVGNDTAFTVRVFNPIDINKLEINSLEFVASSHPVDMQYVFHERHMKFTFNNILLVDSATNEPMSHGFIRYKIKPKSNLVISDSIRNFATIHFDFEAAVLTNTALTTVEQPTGLPPGSTKDEHGTMWIWPNPVKENLSIGFRLKSETEISIDVINIYGQSVARKILFGKTGENKFDWSLETLPNGVYFIKANVAGKQTQAKVVKL